jgi:hypothetical protein
LQLQKPPPAEACVVPGKQGDMPVSPEISQVIATHKTMSQLLAMALACNQTRVFNMVFSSGNLRKQGDETPHHTLTHEETVDPALGYQPRATYFLDRTMEAWVTFVQALDAVREGDGTLLDNTLVFAHSDIEYGRTHSVLNLPIMTAGRGGGRVKTGIHVSAIGDSIARTGLTMMQAMGLPVDKWGTGGMQTSKTISEILV